MASPKPGRQDSRCISQHSHTNSCADTGNCRGWQQPQPGASKVLKIHLTPPVLPQTVQSTGTHLMQELWKSPNSKGFLCSSAGTSRGSHVNAVHKSQRWSKGCVYPRSKDCLSSQQMQPHSGLLQLQCLHNIMLKPLAAESFLTLACPGIASVWPFINPRKFYSWRKEKS